MFVVFPLNIVMAVACAAISYRFVETPFLRLKRHFEPGRVHAAPPAVAETEGPSGLRQPDMPFAS
jgi:peptidoglycan/LPS O-acetylase OafA/YrhL